jgi:hypothetical protein
MALLGQNNPKGKGAATIDWRTQITEKTVQDYAAV